VLAENDASDDIDDEIDDRNNRPWFMLHDLFSCTLIHISNIVFTQPDC
jgi:hypothetical protein